MIPTRHQWRKWSLPAKASYVGVPLAVMGLVLTVVIAYLTGRDPPAPLLAFRGVGRSGETQTITANEPAVLFAYLVNSGQGAAHAAKMFGCSALGPREMGPDDRCPPLVQGGDSSVLIAPGAEQFVSLPVGPFSDEQVTALQSGSIKLSILVGADYEDAKGLPHHSEFCVVYSPVERTWLSCSTRSDRVF